jgi:hypothetical protein
MQKNPGRLRNNRSLGRAGAAGVEAELHVFEAMPHGDLLGEELFQPGDQQEQVEVHIRVAGPGVGRDGDHLWEATNFVARRVGEKLGPDCVLASFSQATCGGYGVSETL